MAKHIQINAFTTIEMIFVLIIISILMMITLYKTPKYHSTKDSLEVIKTEIMYQQSESLLKNQKTTINFSNNRINKSVINGDIMGNPISINEKGNVNLAQTIYLINDNIKTKITIWLGIGRIVYEAD